MDIVADLQEFYNRPGFDHYCSLTDIPLKPCRPYIITEGTTVATVVCPDSGQGYIWRRIKGGWWQDS